MSVAQALEDIEQAEARARAAAGRILRNLYACRDAARTMGVDTAELDRQAKALAAALI